MSISAIYENGVFKPLEGVSIPESTLVELEFSPTMKPPPAGAKKREKVWGLKLGLIGELPADFHDTPPEFDSVI